MGRYRPKLRSVLLGLIERKLRDRNISGPVFVALVDRAAVLDKLYEVALTKPDWRPSRMKPEVETEEVEETEADREADKLYDRYLKQQYGGTNGAAGDSSPGTKNNEGTGEVVRTGLEQKQSSDPAAG